MGFMGMSKLSINFSDVTKYSALIVTIRGPKRLKARVTLGVWLIKAGAKVIGMDVHINGPLTGGNTYRSKTYLVGENVEDFTPTGT